MDATLLSQLTAVVRAANDAGLHCRSLQIAKRIMLVIDMPNGMPTASPNAQGNSSSDVLIQANKAPQEQKITAYSGRPIQVSE